MFFSQKNHSILFSSPYLYPVAHSLDQAQIPRASLTQAQIQHSRLWVRVQARLQVQKVDR